MLRRVDTTSTGLGATPVLVELGLLQVGAELSFGRSRSSSVLLRSPEYPFLVSRSHARVVCLANGFGVEDLASVNGTCASPPPAC